MMLKVCLLGWQTYKRSVFHPAFLMFTLGLPLICIAVGSGAAYFILKATEGDKRPIGVVDLAGLLSAPEAWQPLDPSKHLVPLKVFSSEAEAESALRARAIQAYYVIASDYVTTGNITEVSAGGVADRVRDQVRNFLVEGLLKTTPPEYRARIVYGSTLLHRSLSDQRELTFQLILQWGVAGFVLVAFYFINSASSSDMLYALREEEEQGTLEIALTSLTVEQLLAGKIAGIVAAGLTQFAAWAVGAAVPVLIGLQYLNQDGIEVSLGPVWNTLALCLALLLPAYIMNATGVILLSALTDLAGRGEQVVSVFSNLVGVFIGPLTLIAISAPDNPLAVALSLIPLTSPLIMVTRFVQVTVPPGQILLAVGLVWGAMVFNVLAVARLYRATWLMVGQRNWLRSVWLALSGR